jgi:kumamolisin
MALPAQLLKTAAGLGLVLAAVTAPSASAQVSPATSSVTVLLRAPHPAALSALARRHDLSHAQRVARLKRLVPQRSAVRSVTAALIKDGLRVTGRTAWSITAAGSASDLSDGRLSVAPDAVAGPPEDLSRYVAGVLPTVGPPAFHDSSPQPVDGNGFRKAYAAKGKTPPGAGRKADGKSTVATLQLADYQASDLTTYARKQHPALPNIVGTPRYRKVIVDGGPSGADDSTGGDIEVALDQESILSTAPSARQRPYFAPNTAAGFVDVFSSVFDDVVQNHQATDGGDPHIVALSTSWGGCEADDGAAQIHATQTVIKALVAAGVTVFAASGDDGIYDCGDPTGVGLGNNESGVDYPASSPQVVGVGGTNLQHNGAKVRRNNGHNWRETAWSCSSPGTCEGSSTGLPVLPAGTGGTGGGASGLSSSMFSGSAFPGFAEPHYQKRSLRGGVFGKQHHRLVPDIAADGDPQTGFKLYSSDPQVAGAEDSRGLVQVGGTSLSSPVSAALFANTLAAAGRHTGIGDIHAALYDAYRHGGHAFRDVTAGTNGAAADRGRDPSVSARRGYDTVTGLGGVLWPKLTPYLHVRKATSH